MQTCGNSRNFPFFFCFQLPIRFSKKSSRPTEKKKKKNLWITFDFFLIFLGVLLSEMGAMTAQQSSVGFVDGEACPYGERGSVCWFL